MGRSFASFHGQFNLPEGGLALGESLHAVVRAYWAETLWADLQPKLPGAEASYRGCVILKTGNERASNVVTVERPVG